MPAYFGWKLYRNREVIQSGNFAFASIAPLRPLFMFFKPDCYYFEVFFMVEKLLLTGRWQNTISRPAVDALCF